MTTLVENLPKRPGWRLTVWLTILGLCFLALGARLAWLQVERHDHYEQLARRQQHRVLTLNPPRGTLYDAQGRELAVSAPADSIYADPKTIESPEAVAEALAPLLGKPAAELAKKMRSDGSFVWLARQVDEPVAAAVRELKLRGVGLREESRRYYPYGDLAAHVLGFVGTDFHGLAGIEAQFETTVAGQAGRRVLLRDASGNLAVAPDLHSADPQPGRDLHLTIDATLQHIAERELAAAIDKFDAESGSVVLLDPHSGAVLAMASWPTYDPNRFNAYRDKKVRWRNRPVTDAYEPGSVFKVVAAAGALEENLVDPSDVIDCQNGQFYFQGVRIRDYKPFGLLTFREVIAKSSNIGTIKIEQRLGDERFYERMLAFGFGARTGVDLPGESPGILRKLENWPPRAGAYAAFGQGLSVTTIQLAAAYAAIANGGVRYQPYVVSAIGNGADREVVGLPTPAARVMTASTAREVGRLLEAVVNEGTAKKARIDGFQIAGKTSTAQIAVQGGYSETDHFAIFSGFAPARAPRLVGAIAIDRPRGDIHGGSVAAPAFSAILYQSLLAMGVAPETAVDEALDRERIAGAAMPTEMPTETATERRGP